MSFILTGASCRFLKSAWSVATAQSVWAGLSELPDPEAEERALLYLRRRLHSFVCHNEVLFFFFAGLVWQQALSKTTVNPEHACSACVYFFAASGEDQAWRRWGGGDWLWLRIMNKGAAQARSGCLVAWGWTLFSQKDEFHMHPLMDFAATGQRHPLWNIIWESSIIFWVDRPEHQDLLINRPIAAGRSIRERDKVIRDITADW